MKASELEERILKDGLSERRRCTPKKPSAARRFNREERANLAHALMHLEDNKIADDSTRGGWYCGNKEQFTKRHVKAIAFVRLLLERWN
jgi:hypothetical protein